MFRTNHFWAPFAISVFGSLLVGGSGLNALEDVETFVDPDVIRSCVNQLLYKHTFPDGSPAGDRTIIDPASASLACRGVTSKDEADLVRQCINGLLYTETFTNGNPAGDRTIIDPASASRACSVCKSHT